MKISKLSFNRLQFSQLFAVTVSTMTLFILFALSCSKDGVDGLPGTNGIDGASILSGTGAPAETLGREGDYYLNKTLAVLYGPKAGTSWGTGIILTGPAGTPGNTILSGTVAPAANLGVNGDFYINRNAKTIYGPKSVSGWGSATSMAGPAGTNGTNGTNADVRYTNWFTAASNSRDTAIDGTCLRIRHQHISAMTPDVLNTGLVLVYFRVGSLGPYMLPYISDAGGATNSINFIIKENKVFFYRHTFNTCRYTSANPEIFPGQPVMINIPQSLEYRIIIIPGITVFPATKSRISDKVLDCIKDLTYEEVCEKYSIPE